MTPGQPSDALDLALIRIEQLEQERDRMRFLFSYALSQIDRPLMIPRDTMKEAKTIPYGEAIFDCEGYVGFKSKTKTPPARPSECEAG